MAEPCSAGCGRKARSYAAIRDAAACVTNTLPAWRGDGMLVLYGRLITLSAELAGVCPQCAFREVVQAGISAELNARRATRGRRG